jgi:hypothetical protein
VLFGDGKLMQLGTARWAQQHKPPPAQVYKKGGLSSMSFRMAAAGLRPLAHKTLLRIYFLDEWFDFSNLVMSKGVLSRAACALQSLDKSSQDLAESQNTSPALSAHQMAVRQKKSHGL